jgi:translation elongation factor EF-1alpha
MNKGQTKQHVDIIRGMHITHLIVGINKMDTSKWDPKVYQYIKSHMQSYFDSSNFPNSANIKYIPMSAYQGDNLTFNMDLDYYKGNCLLKEIQNYEIEDSIHQNGIEKPIRLTIKNVYRNNKGVLKGRLVEVKVEGGTVQLGTKLKVVPGNILFSVKNMYINNKAIRTAQFGDVVDLVLNMDKDTDFDMLFNGCIGNFIFYFHHFLFGLYFLNLFSNPVLKFYFF